MLTPVFSLEQDDDHLVVKIKAPLAKITEAEVFIDGHEFKFFSKPYYLRLNLPGEIRNDSEKAQYIADEGTFIITVDKERPGEQFDGLDMLTKLLAPTGASKASAPLIEVLGSDETGVTAAESVESEDEEEEFDWQVEQDVFTEEAVGLEAPTYGFASKRSGVLGRLQPELHDVVDLRDADKTPETERRKLRMEDEQQRFSDDHYLADLYEDEAIQPLLKYKSPWGQELKSSPGVEGDPGKLSSEEIEKMLKLPKKEYLLSKKEDRAAMLGLVDILFAFAYDQRVNEGDSNVESPWTICKLSGTLSWLENYRCVEDVVISCFRRCLTYPLYRHYKLTKKVFRDTIALFKLGRRRLLKSLLHVHGILQSGDNTYVLNELYVTDYCVWIQHVREKRIRSMATALEKVEISRGKLGLDLIELERAAQLAVQEDLLNRGRESSAPDPDGGGGAVDAVTEAAAALQELRLESAAPRDPTGPDACAAAPCCGACAGGDVPGKPVRCQCKVLKTERSDQVRDRPTSQSKKESGTEDSSLSSETSDSSDSSEDSSSSADSSDTEQSDGEGDTDKTPGEGATEAAAAAQS